LDEYDVEFGFLTQIDFVNIVLKQNNNLISVLIDKSNKSDNDKGKQHLIEMQKMSENEEYI